MQNPVEDIKTVISNLIASESPDAQQTAVYRHYAPNAGFRSPFVRVDSGPLSREKILGIWQWYRILSPKASVHIERVVYDKSRNILLVDVTQQFHVFFFPLESTSRILTRLTLTEDKGLYLIALQEDFYEPEGVAAMICPHLASLTRFGWRTFASISTLLAKSFQGLNYWRPNSEVVYTAGFMERIRDSEKPDSNVKRKDKKPNRPNVPAVPDTKQPEQGPSRIATGYEYGQN